MITQNGRSVVGFGDTAVVAPVSNPGELAIRVALLGATAAGTLGGLIGGRKGTLIGIAVGGAAAGGIAYASLRGPAPGTQTPQPQPAPAPTPSTPTTVQMVPGQVWTMVGVVRPTKAWTDVPKSAVEYAVTVALAKIGLSVLDGTWTADYTFTVAVQPNQATSFISGTVFPLNSEWADQIAFSNVMQAPAGPPPIA